MNYIVTLVMQLCLNFLKKNGGDVRMVYDNPEGTLSFQGSVKYAKKMSIPKRG